MTDSDKFDDELLDNSFDTQMTVDEKRAHKQALVVSYRRRGWSFADIAPKLGVTRQRAHQLYWEAMREIVAEGVEDMRTEAAARLDALRRETHAILERHHPVLYQGQPVEDVEDDGVRLAAIRELRALEERWARLFGLDAPVKVEQVGEASVRHEVVLPEGLREKLT